MLNPNDTYNLNQLNSPYANVIAIAKRARQISEDAEENHEIISEKPILPFTVGRILLPHCFAASSAIL